MAPALTQHTYKSILVLVDTAETEHPVLERAVQLAQHHRAALKMVDIVPEFTWPQRFLVPNYADIQMALARDKRESLKALAAKLGERGVIVTTQVLEGRSSVEMIREVLRGQHDLILKPAKGRRSRRLGFFGATATELLRKCPCDVWLFRPGAVVCQNVVAAVNATPDDAEHSQLNARIMERAVALCRLENARLDVAHVWSVYGESVVKDYMKPGEFAALEQSLAEESRTCLETLAAKYGLSAASGQVHLLRGEPEREIPKLLRERHADLFVIGTIARHGIPGLLLGNTAESILGQVDCSVLAVKPAGFVSPITVPVAAECIPPSVAERAVGVPA